MTQPNTRSLCLALGRLRFVVVTACWIIALCLVVQLIVWSLCSFTELRYAGPAVSGDVPLIVDGDDKQPDKKAANEKDRTSRRWRPETEEQEKPEQPVGTMDRVFRIIVTVARTMGLMGALIICPLLSMGLLLAVPAGAPKVERAVNALTWAIVLVLLAMPLGGWFGMAWQQGTITDYRNMVAEVETALADGFSSVFYARFLLLPAASAVGFVLVGIQFNSSVVAVLLRRDGILDPELEKEASNVAATSLHGTGRTAGALSKALEADKKARKKRMGSMQRGVVQGDAPKRLI